MRKLLLLAFALTLSAFATPSYAAPGFQLCDGSTPPNCVTVTGNKLDVNATTSGGATSAKQDSAQTSLSSIVTNTTQNGGYPVGATPVTISATGSTGAVVATLPATTLKTTYVCGFTITSDATAALAGNATLAGILGGTMTFIQNVGSATAAGVLTQPFSPCVPASAVNTTIVVTSVAAGTGGSTAVNAWGFQL